MIEKSIIIEIEKLLDNKKIIDSKLLSSSFGIAYSDALIEILLISD